MRKLLVVLLTLVMVMNVSVFASVPIQSSEVEVASFLSEKDISLSLINGLKDMYDLSKNDGKVVLGTFNDKIIEIKNLAATYDFSKEQIEDYIKGVISTPTVIIEAPDIPEISNVSLASVPESNRVGDDGIGYEVKSNSGYVKQSAYLTLPEVSITNQSNTSLSSTSAYMFYSFETGGYAVDIGLWYHYGNGGWGWRDTYLRSFAYAQDEHGNYIKDNNGNYIKESNQTVNGLLGVDAGDSLFMEAAIVYDSNGQRYIQCRITDGNNLNSVKSDFSVWVGNYIGSSSVIDRQVTLCNSAMNFNTGEKIEGAEFRNAKIFTSTSGTGILINTNHTNNNYCGRFGKYGNDYKQVKVNNYNQWNMENIDIYFDSSMQNIGA